MLRIFFLPVVASEKTSFRSAVGELESGAFAPTAGQLAVGVASGFRTEQRRFWAIGGCSPEP